MKHDHDALTHDHDGGDRLHWHKPPAETRLDVLERKLAAIETRHAEFENLISKLMRLAAQNPIGRRMLERLGREGVTL